MTAKSLPSTSDYYRERARELVEANKDRFPDLLVEQFGASMEAEAREIGRSGWMHEFALVTLRMLKDAGKLKARTDDERALLEWIEQQPRFHAPAANRRLAFVGVPPDAQAAYSERVAVNAQFAFDIEDAA